MLIDVPDANEVQWEKPASNWELCRRDPQLSAHQQKHSLTWLPPPAEGGAEPSVPPCPPRCPTCIPTEQRAALHPDGAGSRSHGSAVRGKAHSVFLQLGRLYGHWKPQFLYLRTVKGLHLICEPVKYYTGNGPQLSVTGNLILVSCGAMLLLPVKARTHQSINNP